MKNVTKKLICFLALTMLSTAWAIAQPPPPPLAAPNVELLPSPTLVTPPVIEKPPVKRVPLRAPILSNETVVTNTNLPEKISGPQLVVTQTGPGSVRFQQPFWMELLIRNTGDAPAFNIVAQCSVPGGTKLLSAEPLAQMEGAQLRWSLDSLESGQQRKLRIELSPVEEVELRSDATVTYSQKSDYTAQVVRPMLVVRKSGPEKAGIGDTVPFRIEVYNPGSAPATNVIVVDQLPNGFEHPRGNEIEAELGTVEPGQTRVIDLEVQAVRAGEFINIATATADDNLRSDARAIVQIGKPILRVAKSGPRKRYLNTEAFFEILVENAGDAAARNVELVDQLPPNLMFVSATQGGDYDAASQRIQWQLGDIPPGEARSVSVVTKATEIGAARNTARATADFNISGEAALPIDIVGVPALLLEVVDTDDPIEKGNETVYEVRVGNQGTAENTNVQLIASIPDGLTPIRVNADVPHQQQGGQVIFDPVGRLRPGVEIFYRITVRGDLEGDHRFKVQLKSDQIRVPVVEEESTHVYKAE